MKLRTMPIYFTIRFGSRRWNLSLARHQFPLGVIQFPYKTLIQHCRSYGWLQLSKRLLAAVALIVLFIQGNQCRPLQHPLLCTCTTCEEVWLMYGNIRTLQYDCSSQALHSVHCITVWKFSSQYKMVPFVSQCISLEKFNTLKLKFTDIWLQRPLLAHLSDSIQSR